MRTYVTDKNEIVAVFSEAEVDELLPILSLINPSCINPKTSVAQEMLVDLRYAKDELNTIRKKAQGHAPHLSRP
jgi:hypothetical protein